MRVVILQPIVPDYRRPLFEGMAKRIGSDFMVYASSSASDFPGTLDANIRWYRALEPIRRVLPGLYWQPGAVALPISRGDVVIVSGAPRTLSNIALLIRARVRGAKTIWWGHYWSATSRSWRAKVRMPLMHLANAIVFYSDREVAEYRARWRSTKKPVLALNNGIFTREILSLRAPYAPLSRTSDLLFIGRITPKANLGLLLEALSLDPCKGIRLEVVGGGISEPILRRQCLELGIAERVRWHGSVKQERCIAKIANTCKLFVYPGAVGLSLMHAFTYGLPAVVHDDRWKHMPEIAAFRPEQNGASFKFGNASDLAGTIRRLLDDPHRLEAMSFAAAATTATTFNTDDMTERFLRAVAAASE